MTDVEPLYQSALLSEDGRYRYHLARWWGSGDKRLVWIMLNPSTADATDDDATLRRVVGFTRRLGYNRAEVINLFPWRSRHPDQLLELHPDQIDPDGVNLARWLVTLADGPPTIAAWGAHRAVERLRHPDPTAYQPASDGNLWCLGTTRGGHPRHPLYLRAAARLATWP